MAGRKNVTKIFRKKFTHESILSRHHEPGRFDSILVLDHLKPGFNVAKIFRTANVFSCREVHMVGIPFFDVRAAMGGFKHTRSRNFDTMAQSIEALRLEGYTIYGLVLGATAKIQSVKFPTKSAFILGHEEFGLSFDPKDYPDIQLIEIPQFGQVQSLNVSVAAGVVLYEYLRQTELLPDHAATT